MRAELRVRIPVSGLAADLELENLKARTIRAENVALSPDESAMFAPIGGRQEVIDCVDVTGSGGGFMDIVKMDPTDLGLAQGLLLGIFNTAKECLGLRHYIAEGRYLTNVAGTLPEAKVASLRVIFPNLSAVKLTVGTAYVTSWMTDVAVGDTTPRTEHVALHLYKDGAYFQTISSQEDNTEAGSTYTWTIPLTVPSGKKYRFRVLSYLDPTRYDMSDEDIEIIGLSVAAMSPAAGQEVNGGMTHLIQWTYTGPLVNVKIELWNGIGTAAVEIGDLIASTPANTHQYLWAVSTALAKRTDYFLKISSVESTWLTANSPYFTIIKPVITVTAPVALTSVKQGGWLTAEWTSEGDLTLLGNTVDVSLLKGGVVVPGMSATVSRVLPGLSYGQWVKVVPAGQTVAADYQVRVAGIAVTGLSATFAITAGSAPGIPSAPTPTVVGPTCMMLRWTPNSTDESGFTFQRKTGLGGWVDMPALAAVAQATMQFDYAVVQHETYTYRVSAWNGYGASAWSAASAAVEVDGFTPETPVLAGHIEDNSSTAAHIHLTWTPGATNQSSFILTWWVNVPVGIPVMMTVTLAATLTEYVFAGLPSTDYRFSLKARNTYGDSGESQQVAIRTSGLPAVPANVAAVPYGLPTGADDANAIITWTRGVGGEQETGFRIYRGLTSTTLVLHDTVAAGTFRLQDTALAEATLYYYSVSAYNAIGESARSATKSVTTNRRAFPLAPTGVSAEAYEIPTSPTTAKIRIDWTPAIGGGTPTGFIIRNHTPGDESIIATAAATDRYYIVTGLNAETYYDFTVEAHNDNGSSARVLTDNVQTNDCVRSIVLAHVAIQAVGHDTHFTWTVNNPGPEGYAVEIGPGLYNGNTTSTYFDYEIPAGYQTGGLIRVTMVIHSEATDEYGWGFFA